MAPEAGTIHGMTEKESRGILEHGLVFIFPVTDRPSLRQGTLTATSKKLQQKPATECSLLRFFLCAYILDDYSPVNGQFQCYDFSRLKFCPLYALTFRVC